MEQFEDIIRHLEHRMQGPLPGPDSQMQMASRRRLLQGLTPPSAGSARIGAVLILLYPHQDKPHTVFIRRNEYEGIHSGQISFPGGQQEDSDSSYAATALREAWEETGIDPARVKVMGELTSLYIPPSNFLVYPVLGYSSERPDFRPDITEVQEIIVVPLHRFYDADVRQEHDIPLPGGQRLRAPCFVIGNAVIWGATAMILNELLELAR